MNKLCFGDRFYTEGKRFYRCLVNEMICKHPRIDICPICLRKMYVSAQATKEVETRTVCARQVKLPRWGWCDFAF